MYNDMSDYSPCRLNAMRITNSAIVIIEMMNGKYDNLKSGSVLDITGMTEAQRKSTVSLLEKSGKNDIIIMEHDAEGKGINEAVINRKDNKTQYGDWKQTKAKGEK